MKESKYRGWSPDLKTWIYGAYFEHCTCAVCLSEENRPEYHEAKIIFEQINDWGFPYNTKVADVVPESVGAFTGFQIDGAEVYEGDVIISDRYAFYGVIKYGQYGDYHKGFYVDWNEHAYLRTEIGYWMNEKSVKIVGNIFENPELKEKVYGEDKR